MDGGTIVLLIFGSMAIVGLLGALTVSLSCNLSCNGQEGAAAAVLIFGCLITAGVVAWLWTAVAKKHREEGAWPEKPTYGPLPDDAVQVEVESPNLQICLEAVAPEGMEGVTVTYNGKVLMGEVPIGSVPLCFDLKVQPDMLNAIEVSGNDGPVKLTVEDGRFPKVIK